MAHHHASKAVKGEIVSATLPRFQSEDGTLVYAGLIVAISLSSLLGAGESRLVIAGGLHVDVPKPWVVQHKPQAGAYYVQKGDTAEIVEGDLFQATYQPAPDAFVAESAAEGTGQQSAAPTDYMALIDTAEFVKWFSIEPNADRFGRKLSTLFRNLYMEQHTDAPITGQNLTVVTADAETGLVPGPGSPSVADLDAIVHEHMAAAQANGGGTDANHDPAAQSGSGDGAAAGSPPSATGSAPAVAEQTDAGGEPADEGTGDAPATEEPAQ
jgi:hypothetical protein